MTDVQNEALYEEIRLHVVSFLSAIRLGFFDIDVTTSCIDKLHVWDSPLVKYAPLTERLAALKLDVQILLYNFDEGQFFIGMKQHGGAFSRDQDETAFITSLRPYVTPISFGRAA